MRVCVRSIAGQYKHVKQRSYASGELTRRIHCAALAIRFHENSLASDRFNLLVLDAGDRLGTWE